MLFRLFIGFILSLSLYSCNEKSSSSIEGSGLLRIMATDAPFNFDLIESAEITVGEILVRKSSGSKITVSEKEMTLDLLKLRNGVVETLADIEIPAGSYDEILLIVRNASVDMKDGRHFDLTVPSGAQSGLKIFVKPEIVITTNMSTDVLLDFDLSQSFVPQGTANNITGFNFKPVIRAANLSNAGSISGQVESVVNDELLAGAVVTVLSGTEVVATAVTDENGYFKVIGLTEGAYNVTAEKSQYSMMKMDSVSVTAGNEVTTQFVLTPIN
jgi:hypothetical protein